MAIFWQPPPPATQALEAARYLHVATVGMFAWDILMHLGPEYYLLSKFKFSISTAMYFVSRYFCFTTVVISTVFDISQVQDCALLQKIIGVMWAISLSTTSLLFLQRIRAVFSTNRPVIYAFYVLWLMLLGLSISLPWGIDGDHDRGTLYCVHTAVRPFASGILIGAFVNDTCVFLAISWAFSRRSRELRDMGMLRSRITMALISSGQQYYLVTVLFSLISVGLVLSPQNSVPPVVHSILNATTLAITSVMACKVYRDVKLSTLSSSTDLRSISHVSSQNTKVEVTRIRHTVSVKTARSQKTINDVALAGQSGHVVGSPILRNVSEHIHAGDLQAVFEEDRETEETGVISTPVVVKAQSPRFLRPSHGEEIEMMNHPYCPREPQ